MKQFVSLVDALGCTTATSEKVRLLAGYLEHADPEDAAWAVQLLSGSRKRRAVSSARLRQILLDHSTLPEWLFRECYSHVGDSAETVTLLIEAGHFHAPDDEPVGDGASGAAESPSLSHWMRERIAGLAGLTSEEQAARITRWWTTVPRAHLYVLNKLITGGFRLGVSRATMTKALAQALGVSQAAVTLLLTGGFTPSPEFFTQIRETGDRAPSQPYPFFLASPIQDEVKDEPLHAFRVEWKWDGIRAQIIRREGNVYIWSRGEELVTGQFPEIAEACDALPDGTVLDCELLAWEADAPLPFHRLQRRLGRKRPSVKMQQEVPVVALVFDCLESGGNDIRALPLAQRLAARDSLLPAADPRLRTSDPVSAADWETLEQMRRRSQEQNVEGFVLKRHGSPYRQGRKRGDWWKFKRDPFSLDAVLIYAQAGSGKRANLFTDYTFALRDGADLVPFAKAYSGLSNTEIAELDRWIRRHTTERF